MASKLISIVGLLALSGCCMAGVAPFAYNPFLRTYATAPAYVKSATFVAAAPVVKTYAAAPVIHAAPLVKAEEVDPHPQYDYAYGVHDSVTGDIKNQVESRDGGNVAGSYSVIDADGYKRTVTYTADDVNGFNAVVQRDPIVAKTVVSAAPVFARTAAVVQPATLVQAVPAPAPIIKTYAAAPLVQAAPVLQAPPVVKTFVQTAPVVRTYTAAPFVQAAVPVVHATPAARAYAATPVVHATPVLKSYAADRVAHAGSVFSTYSTAPVVRASYLAPAAVQQFHSLPLQQQLSYFSAPSIAVQEQNHQLQELNDVNDVQAHKQTQELAAPQQSENEPTLVEYPQQEEQQEQQEQQQQQEKQEQQQQQQEQQQYQHQQEQEQKQQQYQYQQNQYQQLIGEQQKLFTEQQQHFAEQQQQVILQQQQLVEQQQQYFQQQQQQFASNQQFPPYPQYEIPQNQLTHPEPSHNNDSEIVEGRSANPEKQQETLAIEQHRYKEEAKFAARKSSASTTVAPAPAPVNEEQKESDDKIKTKSA